MGLSSRADALNVNERQSHKIMDEKKGASDAPFDNGEDLFSKTFNERPKVRQFYPKVKSSRDNDGRTFQDAHSAYHRLATIKKCSKPGADQITQEEIDLAMEEFKSREDK